jgi:hypothetical protein
MKPDQKETAAIAAVAAYIKSQEEAATFVEPEPAIAEGVEAGPASIAAMPVWRVSGRQQQMQMRNLMQMKALHRAGGWRR